MAQHTTPIAGVNLTQTIAGTGTSFNQGNQFALGTIVAAKDGQEYIYVHASEAITQYDFVAVDEDFECAQLTATEAGDGWQIGVAQTALADNDFGWVAIKGANLTGNVAGACAADVALKTTSTGGVIDDNTTGTYIAGVVAVAANTYTTDHAVEVMLTWPRSDSF